MGFSAQKNRRSGNSRFYIKSNRVEEDEIHGTTRHTARKFMPIEKNDTVYFGTSIVVLFISKLKIGYSLTLHMHK